MANVHAKHDLTEPVRRAGESLSGLLLYSSGVQQPLQTTAIFGCYEHAVRSVVFEREQRRAASYGSEGWGFESLRARYNLLAP